MRSHHPGFTLIELLIVVAIIGILAAIAIPNFVSMTVRAKESAVKANIHSCQLAVEENAAQNGGFYPGALAPGMFPGGIFPENPFTGAPIVIGALAAPWKATATMAWPPMSTPSRAWGVAAPSS